MLHTTNLILEENMVSLFELKDLITAGGLLLGFQLTSFSWRISQETKTAEKGDIVWLSPADYLNLLAMIITVVGIFIAPILGLIDIQVVQILLGLVALLYLGHALALAGHYELYSRGQRRSFSWFPRQEKIVVSIVFVIIVLYIAGTLFIFSK
jgi:hypothetical protein